MTQFEQNSFQVTNDFFLSSEESDEALHKSNLYIKYARKSSTIVK